MSFRFVLPVRVATALVALALAAAPIRALQTPSPSAPAQALAMKGYPALGAPPIINVVKTGSAPRRQLRYAIPSNLNAHMDVTAIMSTSAGSGNVVIRTNQALPAMKVSADLAVTGIAPNGDVAYEVVLSGMTLEARAGVEAEVMQGLQQFVALVPLTKGETTISSSGVVKSTRLDFAPPALRTVLGHAITAIEHLSVPFPEVAVGVGARWEVRQAMEVGGLTTFSPTVYQKTDYEVLAIDGSAVSLQMTTEQTAPPQLMIDPSLPVSNQGIQFGAENRLQKLSGSGAGTVVVHLDSLVPVSTHEFATSMTMTMLMNEKTVPLTVEWKVKITIAPPGVAPADKPFDLKVLRGLKAVHLGGSATSSVGPGRVCYPRAGSDPRAGVGIVMGGFLRAAAEVLKTGGIEASPRSTDFLEIDAQILDAAECHATITLELRHGLGKADPKSTKNGERVVGYERSPVRWRRTFEITGAPAGFSGRVADRFEVAVREFVSDVAQANLRK